MDDSRAVRLLSDLQLSHPSRDDAGRAQLRGKLHAAASGMRAFYEQAQYFDAEQRAEALKELDAWTARLGERLDGGGEAGGNADRERLGVDRLLAKNGDAIERAAQELGRAVDPPPLLGSARTGEASARTFLVPGTRQAVVLVDVEFFIFSLVWAGLVAGCFPIVRAENGQATYGTRPEAVEAHLASRPANALRCVRSALMFREGMRPDMLQVSPDMRYEPLARQFREAVQLFVVGHEYAHSLCGHLDQTPSHLRDRPDASGIAFARDQELEADLRGAELCLRAMQHQGVPPQFGVIGPDTYFSGRLALHQIGLLADEEDATVLDAARLSPPGTGTHPPIRDRRDRLRETVLASMPAELREATSRTYQALDCMNAALLIQAAGVIAWQRNHAAGSPPALIPGPAAPGEADATA